jgi:hypothetical protein
MASQTHQMQTETYEPTQDDMAEYAAYLDATDDRPDPAEAEADEAARVAAWLEKHGLAEVPF